MAKKKKAAKKRVKKVVKKPSVIVGVNVSGRVIGYLGASLEFGSHFVQLKGAVLDDGVFDLEFMDKDIVFIGER